MLGALMQQAITQANYETDLCRYMASVGHSKYYGLQGYVSLPTCEEQLVNLRGAACQPARSSLSVLHCLYCLRKCITNILAYMLKI